MDRPGNYLRLAVAACLSALTVGLAHSALPDSGWYWNPAEDGRGFNIEIQDDKIFMSAFAYKPDGSPVWYVAGGPMTSDRAWSADLFETANGQSIGGAYRSPAVIPRGRASITFTNEKTAQVTLLGTTVNVQRQDWSGYGANASKALAGEWSTSEGDPSFPVYYSDRVTLNQSLVDSSGAPFLGGFRTGTSATRNPAVGKWDAANGVFVILVDSSTSYYSLYIFTLNGLNRAEGLTWTYAKSASPTGSGTYFLANRTKSGTRVQGKNAPGVAKDAPADSYAAAMDRHAIDERRAAQPVAKSAGNADAAEDGDRLEVDPAVVHQLAMDLRLEMGN